MTNSYDFILDNIVYSYSSVNSYETCPHGFFLTYIEAEERGSNFYSEFGLLVHDILEKYFLCELDEKDLTNYFIEHYNEYVKSFPPPYPKNLGESYYEDGISFFDNFTFDRENFEVVFTEEKIESIQQDIKLVVKPDLLLKEKSTGKYILVDYKTSKLKGSKYDFKKLEGYKRQLNLYAYFTWIEKEIKTDEIWIFFIRNNDIMKMEINHDDIIETIEWFTSTIGKIKDDEQWVANTDKSNSYFCSNLCGVRMSCEKNK